MTNKEIIKALECCIEWETPEDCGKCPYKDTKGCVTEQRKNALDLINRQQAEIERLNVDLVGMRGACNSYKMHYDNAKAEIKRLTQLAELGNMRANDYRAMRDKLKAANEEIEELKKVVIDDYASEYDSKIKAEAIREFAERLKLKIDIDLCEAIECSDYLYNLPKLIDNLVKEMVGEQE